ncbi:Outer membrane protein with beta-barrel domain [Tenacibaculum sp. 190524A02b]|uniref:Outer membrane protein with beta-barrel domain n=1 Tax=Tenacibaculum vairaonense TaxID=3137860 RepID=A0ABM9PHE4_9FLAO
MKKLFLIAMILTLGIVNGQEKNSKKIITKDSWFISGGFTINSENEKINSNLGNNSPDVNKFGFGIAPETGIFIDDNLAIGLGIGYSYSKNQNVNDYNRNDKAHVFSFSPFIKKYFSVSKNLLLSVKGELTYSSIKSKSEFRDYNSFNYRTYRTNGNSFDIGIRPGLSYFVSKSIALEANLGFLGYKTTSFENDSDNENITNKFDFNINASNIVFGITFYM